MPETSKRPPECYGYLTRSCGLMPSGHEIHVDQKAWEACLECPRYRTCYDPSLARFHLEAAVRGS